MLTAERLRELLSYDPETGVFTWLVIRGGAKADKPAGTVKRDGYRWIRVDCRGYVDGRLAWLYMTGQWPKHSIDHKNCNSVDCSWDNLREANLSQQAANQRIRKNHATGFKGVHRSKDRFVARIWRHNRYDYVGTYDTAEQAHSAYMLEAIKLHGEFARAA